MLWVIIRIASRRNKQIYPLIIIKYQIQVYLIIRLSLGSIEKDHVISESVRILSVLLSAASQYLSLRFPTRSHTNRIVQPKQMARDWKFWI